MKSLSSIEVNLDHIKDGLRLFIESKQSNTLFDAEESELENLEARYQLVEGCFYDYEINDQAYLLGDIGENIILPHKRKPNLGTITPNIFVGTLTIPIFQVYNNEKIGDIVLEVQSLKSGYRDDYRDMLAFITEKCTDLLLQANSPVSNYFDIDYSKDSQSNYQKFAFVKSIISSEEFSSAVYRVVSSPVTRWSEQVELKDIRQIKRFSNTQVKELFKGGRQTVVATDSCFTNYSVKSVSERITSIRKIDSVDTPENRFVKHVLEVFLKFCSDINNVAVKNSNLDKESSWMIRELEAHLHHRIFKEISKPVTLKLNSPILQRKEGYREVLRVWLMFDLAARLIWTGGEDVYSGGKKDVAMLYEYWLFFKLLDLFQSIFDIKARDISELITKTDNGLNVQIKQGKFIALEGIYDSESRKLNIKFSYNRSFTGRKNYPNSGSWTTTLRPDYTLSFWPLGISENEAEEQELIVHIHFDAKYKVSNLNELLDKGSEPGLNEEKTQNRKGIYKNADLLKMHAYKDAIRRTAGAYVLYPGSKSVNRRGFHEIIPGLGAFPVRPSKIDSGVGDLKAFIQEVIEHFLNRTSQREKQAFRTYEIHQSPPEKGNEVREPLPEIYGVNRDLFPDETFVLVGFYRSEEQYRWIKKNKLYNFRMGMGSGSLVLDKEAVTVRYLLLHTSGDKDSGELWRIVSKGPKVFSKDDLLKRGYSNPSREHYLVIEIESVTDPEFKDVRWDFRKLINYSSGRASVLPFTASLGELVRQTVQRLEP